MGFHPQTQKLESLQGSITDFGSERVMEQLKMLDNQKDKSKNGRNKETCDCLQKIMGIGRRVSNTYFYSL